MTSISLLLKENDEIIKDSKSNFKDPKKARECYREAQLAIYKCTGPTFEEATGRYGTLLDLEEDTENSLAKLQDSVKECNPNVIDITNNITKNLTLIKERERVGLLIKVNKEKINDYQTSLNDLKNEYIKRCMTNRG